MCMLLMIPMLFTVFCSSAFPLLQLLKLLIVIKSIIYTQIRCGIILLYLLHTPPTKMYSVPFYCPYCTHNSVCSPGLATRPIDQQIYGSICHNVICTNPCIQKQFLLCTIYLIFKSYSSIPHMGL